MSDFDDLSKQLASRLGPGEHRLDDDRLRALYDVPQVTSQMRADVAQSLERAGLTVVSDPSAPPLIVRQVERQAGARSVRRPTPPWWRRRWVMVVAAVLALLIVVGALSSPEEDEQTAGTETTTQTQTETTPPAETTPPEPVETFADAVQAADDDNYPEALAIAAALGEDDESRIRRRISRRLATRARAALRDGKRGRARRLLAEARDYPRTAQVTAARASLQAADDRAAARVEQRRIAREQARIEREQAAATAEVQRQADEEAAAAPEPEPSAPSVGEGTCAEVGIENFEVPPGDERDADGDGIACES